MKKIKEFFADMTETVSVTKMDGCGNGTTYITNNGEDDWDWDDEDTE